LHAAFDAARRRHSAALMSAIRFGTPTVFCTSVVSLLPVEYGGDACRRLRRVVAAG
jgi:hypothetical protein